MATVLSPVDTTNMLSPRESRHFLRDSGFSGGVSSLLREPRS